MKSWVIRCWLTGLLVGSIATIWAQEPYGVGWQPYVPHPITMPEAIPFARWNPAASKIKPMNWEQLLNEKVSKERAWEQSVLISGISSGTKRLEVQNQAVSGKFRIGNGTASWSISADHLDARMLHFPMPRNMTPNRPTGSRVAPNGQIKR